MSANTDQLDEHLRSAVDRLRSGATAAGLLPREVPEVLLVCTHNAGRSQLAAALLEPAGPA